MASGKSSIRLYRTADFEPVTILWRVAREKSLPDLQRAKGHFFYEDIEYFQQQILSKNSVWVVVLDGLCVAFMAMRDSLIDQLYVHPDHWRRGIGTALVNYSKRRSPKHVWLYTLQANVNACRFYEKHGFSAERFGLSPPPESEPDVEYHWRV